MACWCGCSALKLFNDLMYCGETAAKRPVGQEFGAGRKNKEGREGGRREEKKIIGPTLKMQRGGFANCTQPGRELTASLMMLKRFSSISNVAIFSMIFFSRMCCLSL